MARVAGPAARDIRRAPRRRSWRGDPPSRSRTTIAGIGAWIDLLSHVLRQPVGRIIDPDLAIVDMGVLGAALFGREDLQRLVLRTDRLEQFWRVLDRNDAVIAAMGDEIGTGDIFGDVLEGELPRRLDRLVDGRRIDHPLELEVRLRHRLWIALVLLLDARLPSGEIPVQRRERNPGGIALLERSDARQIISAEAVAHDGDALRIDLGALRQVVEGRAAWHLVVI